MKDINTMFIFFFFYIKNTFLSGLSRASFFSFKDDIILTLEYIDSFGKVTTVKETLKTNFTKNLFYSSGAHPTNQPLDRAIREAAITLVNNFK